MYLTPAASPQALISEDKENHYPIQDELKADEDIIKHGFPSEEIVAQTGPLSPPTSLRSFALGPRNRETTESSSASETSSRTRIEINDMAHTNSASAATSNSPVLISDTPATDSPIPRGLAKVDLEMDIHSEVRSWDFTDKAPSSRTPSAMLQPYAKYVGTQQSGQHSTLR